MLEKMIRTQTAQKEKQLDEWMQRHDAAHPFPSETVELTPDLVYAPEKYAKIDVFRPRADFPQPLPPQRTSCRFRSKIIMPQS